MGTGIPGFTNLRKTWISVGVVPGGVADRNGEAAKPLDFLCGGHCPAEKGDMECRCAPPVLLPPLRKGTSRKVPRPVGPLAGPRKPWRRFLSRLVAAVDRTVDRMGVGLLFQRRALAELSFPHYEVDLPGRGPGLAGLRIAFLTDLHAGCSMGPGELEEIFSRVGEKGPDLVLLGGDLTNTREKEVLFLEKGLSRIAPPLGIFAVPGNHDYFEGRGIEGWKSMLEDMGVEVLVNTSRRVLRGGDGLWIAGVDDLTEGRPDLRSTLDPVREGEPVILLSHHPDFFFEAAAAGVELTLSGHTHGGQISPLRSLMGHTRFGYWEGWFEEVGAELLVSRGVGTTLLPFRMKAPPEIPVLQVR